MNVFLRARRTRDGLALSAIAVLVSGVIATVGSGVASAAPDPVVTAAAEVSTSTMPTADPLPTAQINGVAWAQAVTGSTVYVAGSFTTARPAGAAAGSSTVSRANGMAYNINDGKMTSFSPQLNGQARAVAVSPNGKIVYYGGDFTTAGGVLHNRLAAFDTTTGAVISTFKASVNQTVRAIVATDTAVYVGGSFTSASGNARSYLAAFDLKGTPTTWAPTADQPVHAMVLSGTKLAIGGMFKTINSAAAYGLAFVSASTGALSTFAASSVVRDAGPNGAITALTTDGSLIYGSGYAHGTGSNFEGTFGASTSTGAIQWMEDCHGDSYGNFARSGAVFVVSHEHDCARIGGFPQSTTIANRATAFVNGKTGTVLKNTVADYANFAGQPATSLLPWFPTMTQGTYTGQGQGAWAINGNASYIVIAGEFPTVGAKAQQGLARFALRSNTANPKSYGPQVLPADWKITLSKPAAGQVKISFPAQWDRDNQTLDYKIYRGTTLIQSLTASSFYWSLPTLAFTDTGLAKGTYSYTVTASDVNYGGTKTVSSVAVTTTVTSGAVAAKVAVVQPNARIAVEAPADTDPATTAVTTPATTPTAGATDPTGTTVTTTAVATPTDTPTTLAGTTTTAPTTTALTTTAVATPTALATNAEPKPVR